MRVCEKYPYVVVTKALRSGQEYHTTYVEILLGQREEVRNLELER